MTPHRQASSLPLLAFLCGAVLLACDATGGGGGPLRSDGGTPYAEAGAGGGAGRGSGGGPGGGPGGGDAGTLDSCFEGLPSRVGTQMVATKRSADGRLRLRIALDTMGQFGTPGTMPWRLVRLGVEADEVVTCVREAAALTYVGSHHNCLDEAQASAGARTFELRGPDRSVTLFTVRLDAGTVHDFVELSNEDCSSLTPLGHEVCRSGGPC